MSNFTTNKPRIYHGWYLVATFFFIALVTTGARGAFGNFVVPMENEFGWNRTTISLTGFLMALVTGMSQPFVGRIFDRTGGRKLILAGLTLTGLVTVLLSLTFHIVFLVIMFGIVASVFSSGASLTNMGALLARWFRRRRATVMGFVSAGASMGGLLLVPFAAYLLMATNNNWRLTWAVLGLIILVLAVPLAFLFTREDPAEMGLRPDDDPEVPTKDGQGPTATVKAPLEVDQWSYSFRSLPIWQMSLSYMVCGATTFVLTWHFVPFAIDRGVTPTMAATVFGVMLGLNVVGSIGSGLLADRFGRKNILALVYFLRGSAYVLLLLVPGDAALWTFAIVAGFSWFATPALTSSLTADVYGLRTLGTLSGISFMFHQLGAAASVLFAAVLYDLTGSYTIPFAIVGGLLFPAALSAFTIKERKYSIRYQAAPAAVAASGD